MTRTDRLSLAAHKAYERAFAWSCAVGVARTRPTWISYRGHTPTPDDIRLFNARRELWLARGAKLTRRLNSLLKGQLPL